MDSNDEKCSSSRDVGGMTGVEQIQADEHCERRLPARCFVPEMIGVALGRHRRTLPLVKHARNQSTLNAI